MWTMRTVAAAVASQFLTITIGTAAVQAQANCNWYAETALKQQQRNERGKCNFSGQGWSSDFKAHLAWCGSVAPDVWQAAARQRESDLATCGSKR